MNNTKLPQINTDVPGPKSIQQIQKARATLGHRSGLPVVIEHGIGAVIEDIDGNRFLDFACGCDVVLGHNHPSIKQDLKGEFKHLLQFPSEEWTNITEEPMVGRTLSHWLFGDSRIEFKVFFVPSKQNALQLSREICYLKKNRPTIVQLIAIEDHTAAENITIRAPYAYCPDCVFEMNYPSCQLHCAQVNHWSKDLDQHSRNTIAGVMVEPFSLELGLWEPPVNYLELVQASARESSYIFLVDESSCALGFSGKRNWHNQNAVPDILIVREKRLYALVVKAELLDSNFDFHIPAPSAFDLIDLKQTLNTLNDSTLQTINSLGMSLATKLNSRIQSFPIVKEINVIGLGIAVVLNGTLFSDSRALKEMQGRIVFSCLTMGVVCRAIGAQSILLAPPITATEEQLEYTSNIVETVLQTITL